MLVLIFILIAIWSLIGFFVVDKLHRKFTTSGNLGIGTNNPDGTLHINEIIKKS